MNILSKIAAMTALLFVFSSCNKDDDDTAPAPAPQAAAPTSTYITGKVDGTDFSTIIMGVTSAICVRNTDVNSIMISGANLAADSMTIELLGITAVGTYTVNESTDSLLSYNPYSGGMAYTTAGCPSVSGTIVVTVYDATHIEGTFSFTGKDGDHCDGASKTVTEGHFRGNF